MTHFSFDSNDEGIEVEWPGEFDIVRDGHRSGCCTSCDRLIPDFGNLLKLYSSVYLFDSVPEGSTNEPIDVKMYCNDCFGEVAEFVAEDLAVDQTVEYTGNRAETLPESCPLCGDSLTTEGDRSAAIISCLSRGLSEEKSRLPDDTVVCGSCTGIFQSFLENVTPPAELSGTKDVFLPDGYLPGAPTDDPLDETADVLKSMGQVSAGDELEIEVISRVVSGDSQILEWGTIYGEVIDVMEKPPGLAKLPEGHTRDTKYQLVDLVPTQEPQGFFFHPNRLLPDSYTTKPIPNFGYQQLEYTVTPEDHSKKKFDGTITSVSVIN